MKLSFRIPALLVAAGLSLALPALPTQGASVAEDDHVIFGVISDTHVTPTKTLQRNRFSKAAKFFSGVDSPINAVDALAVVGDLTDNGTAAELDQWGAIKNADLSPEVKLLASMGNHENSRYADFERNTGNRPNEVTVINGYTFITLSPGAGTLNEATGRPSSTNGSNYAYAVPWLNQQLAIAEAASPDKPIFVFFHHPIRYTFYVSHEWYGSGLAGVLDNHPRAVTFSGHIHTPNMHPQSIWQDGGFTAVNTVTTSYYELETGMIYGSVPPKASEAAQGLIIEASGSTVTIKNYDFISDSWIDQTWTFDVTQPLPYTDAVRRPKAVAPVFAPEAQIRVFNVRDTRVNIEFDQASIPANEVQDIVHSYRYEFRNLLTGRNDADFKTWSDYYFLPLKPTLLYYDGNGNPADVTGLRRSTDYEVRITAYDAWGLASTPLTTTFTTTGPTPAELTVVAQAVAVAAKFEARRADYTTASYAPFATALAAARALIADPTTGTLTAGQALTNLLVAQGSLVLEATDKSTLRGLIAQAALILDDQARYVASSLTDLRDALAAARVVDENPAATQAVIDDATLTLLAGLSKVEMAGDLTALSLLVTIVDGLSPQQFTPASWAPVALAQASARAIVATGAAEIRITSAWNVLTAALGDLQLKARKNGLESAIAVAQSVVDNIGAYTVASVEGLPTALNAAKNVAANENASQAEVDAAQSDLIARVTKARLNPATQPVGTPSSIAMSPAGAVSGAAGMTASLVTAAASVATKAKLTVTTKTLRLHKGQKARLGAKATSASGAKVKVRYSSSKSKVASVSKTGVVKAKRAGKATITLTTSTGNAVKVKVRVTR
ncbi:MAG: metallophosphoesterase [Micrococcales bacterium]|nr:metallophosphoesterase [Micrococcales bacterium]